MLELEFESQMPANAWELFCYHERSGAFERLVPPWERIRIIRREGGVRDGDLLHMRIQKGLFHVDWIARHHGYIPGERFCDRQEKGPFAKWDHHHHFIAREEDSALRDHIHLALPLDPLSRPVASSAVAPMMRRMFAFRHRRTADDLRRLADTGDPKTFIVAGKTTALVNDLAAFLSVGGHRVHHLIPRRKHGQFKIVEFFSGKASHPVERADAVIHTGVPYRSASITDEDAFTYLDYLRGALRAVQRRPDLLLNLTVKRPAMDRYTAMAGLDMHPTKIGAATKGQEERERMLDQVRPYFQREITLYFGSLIQPPMGYLVHLLLRLETYLFLKDSARSPHFHWISRDDAVGAIHHVLCKSKGVEGNLAVINPQPATRADLQQTLIKRNFAGYTWNRMLKVLPWNAPGRPAGMDRELEEMSSIQTTGFVPLNSEMHKAVAHEMGET